MKHFICGFSGSGKTTKLKELAQKEEYKDYDFVDLDDYLFNKFADSCNHLGELIEKKGFEWFRQAERAALLELLEKEKKLWIALGGGTLDEDLMTFLILREDVQGHWICEDFSVCWERIKGDPTRPLVKLGEEKLKEIYQKRLKIYKNFPKLTI